MTIQYKNFIYNEERKFIFAYVPKVACTNWKSLMRYMAGYDDWLDNKLAHDKVNGGLRYLDFGNPSDYALLKDPGIKKYTMVRDPYSRVLSAYLNKIENRLPPQAETDDEDHFRKVVRDIDGFRIDKLGSEAYPEITLEVFLLWLQAGESWFTKDEHWAPQNELLLHPDVKFDFVGRFENLNEDAAIILKSMGCDQPFPSQKDVNFAPTDARSKVEQYYSASCYNILGAVFSEDFEVYQYDEDKCLMKDKLNSNSKLDNRNLFDSGVKPEIIEKISENDWMWKGQPIKNRYFEAGWSVGRTLKASALITEHEPKKILDFGCGHGRVLRWLHALFPNASLVASDRVRDGVDFCANTFNATPVYSDDTFFGNGLGEDFDLIWLGSVYTHLSMPLWHKLTKMLVGRLAPKGCLAFSFAGPYVAEQIIGGERNKYAEISEAMFDKFIQDYLNDGFGYARHEGVGDREWGRSIISHSRLFSFLKQENLRTVLLGEQLYANRQDIVIAQLSN